MPLTTEPSNALTYEVVGTIDLAGAEISAYDPATQRLFTTSNSGLQVIDLSDPSNPALIDTIDLTQPPFNFSSNDVSSVAIKDGLIAISVIAATRTDTGKVFLLDADGNLLNALDVGAQPDMVTFTPDGSKLLVANEAEASLQGVAPFVNPEGSISIIDLSGGPAAATVDTVGFTDFNDSAAALIAEGVRLFVDVPALAGTTVAQDLEPEYIAVAPDGLSAVVTLQEANALALLDLSGDEPVITDIVPLGLKDWSGLAFDGSELLFDGSDDDDGENLTADQPVFGMYQPDAIASFSAGGQTYYIMANEGDDRNDFLQPDETIRLSNQTLDPAAFPNFDDLQEDEALGRLNVPRLTSLNGDTDSDGDIDQIFTYGGRSFSIVNADGELVFESGSQIDEFVAETFPDKFADGRSDAKGSEPEGVTVAVIDGRTYAFVVLERFNGTMVYDVTDPASPSFTTFLFNEGDAEPEQELFISADTSPTGDALFVVSNEGDDEPPSVTIYRLVEPQTEGGNGVDDLVGTILDDEMTGGNGDDRLAAIAGDDELSGGNGEDELLAGPGDDLLAGGRGNDMLTTGSGEDIIVIAQGGGLDIVTDFDTEFDAIALEGDVGFARAHEIDYDGDGTTDLLLQLSHGGGSLVLLGVSSLADVQFTDLV